MKVESKSASELLDHWRALWAERSIAEHELQIARREAQIRKLRGVIAQINADSVRQESRELIAAMIADGVCWGGKP